MIINFLQVLIIEIRYGIATRKTELSGKNSSDESLSRYHRDGVKSLTERIFMVENSAIGDNVSPVDNQAATPTSEVAQPVQERMLSQSEVNSLVGSTKQKAKQQGYDQALKDAAQFNGSSQAPQMSPSGDTAAPANTGNQGIPDVENIVKSTMNTYIEQAQQQQQQAAAQAEIERIGAEITPKIEEAKAKHSDFMEVMQVALPALSDDVIKYANGVENSGDVLYELAKNPSKIAVIEMLHSKSPQLARNEMQKLATSIKQNSQSSAHPQAKAPLSQLQHSPVGMDGGGGETLQDFKSKFRV
jgi:hypothetical protein